MTLADNVSFKPYYKVAIRAYISYPKKYIENFVFLIHKKSECLAWIS